MRSEVKSGDRTACRRAILALKFVERSTGEKTFHESQLVRAQAARSGWLSSLTVRNCFADIFDRGSGPVIVRTFPNLIRNKLWLPFIDKESAEYSLIKGSSSNSSGDYMVGLTWERVVRLRTIPFFSRVESAANLVDGLSSGKRDGPWKQVHEVQFPSQAILDMAYECGDMAFKLRAEG